MTATLQPSSIVDVPSERAHVVNARSIAAALGMIALIVPEIWLVGFALVWAIAGLGHLGPTAAGILAVVVAVPVLWATVFVVRAAFDTETDPENMEA